MAEKKAAKKAGAKKSSSAKKTTTAKKAGPVKQGAKKKASSSPRAAGTPTHDEIAQRAYEIHQREGGHHEENWLRAERELSGD